MYFRTDKLKMIFFFFFFFFFFPYKHVMGIQQKLLTETLLMISLDTATPPHEDYLQVDGFAENNIYPSYLELCHYHIKYYSLDKFSRQQIGDIHSYFSKKTGFTFHANCLQ